MTDGARRAATGPVRLIVCGYLNGACESSDPRNRGNLKKGISRSGLQPLAEAFHVTVHRGNREKAEQGECLSNHIGNELSCGRDVSQHGEHRRKVFVQGTHSINL